MYFEKNVTGTEGENERERERETCPIDTDTSLLLVPLQTDVPRLMKNPGGWMIWSCLTFDHEITYTLKKCHWDRGGERERER